MAHTSSIYYPWIEVRDSTWLRTSCLYWDVIRTIVPQSIKNPYTTDDARYLQDEGVLVPYSISSEQPLLRDVGVDFLAYLETDEGKAMILGGRKNTALIHAEKISRKVRELSHIHPDKVHYLIHDMLEDSDFQHRGTYGWLTMHEAIANYYMTLLATRIATQIGTSVVTDEVGADRLGLVARAGAVIPNPVRFLEDEENWLGRYKHMNPRYLAEGAIATLALETIQIAPWVSTSDLLRFRKRYSDELGRFRTAIGDLCAKVERDLPAEAMKQEIWDLYKNELEPSISNMKKALDGQRIGWLAKALLKTSFLSTGPTSMLMVGGGMAVPQALLVGTGISLVGLGILYNEERRQKIRDNPFSYLLRAEKKFGV